MILILWKGQYYIVACFRPGITNLFLLQDAPASGGNKYIKELHSIGTVELLTEIYSASNKGEGEEKEESKKYVEIITIVEGSIKRYKFTYNPADSSYSPQEIELTPEVLSKVKDIPSKATWWIYKNQDVLMRNVMETLTLAGKKLSASPSARPEDLEAQPAEPSAVASVKTEAEDSLAQYIWNKKMHLAYPSSMSGDLGYILRTYDLGIYPQNEMLIHYVPEESGLPKGESETLLLLLQLNWFADYEIIFMEFHKANLDFAPNPVLVASQLEPSEPSSPQMKAEPAEASGAKPPPKKTIGNLMAMSERRSGRMSSIREPDYTRNMNFARNAVLTQLQGIASRVAQPSAMRMKCRTVLNPFACNVVMCQIADPPMMSRNNIFEKLRVLIDIDSLVTKVKEFNEIFGCEQPNCTFILNREARYHTEDNTDAQMVEAILNSDPSLIDRTKYVTYGPYAQTELFPKPQEAEKGGAKKPAAKKAAPEKSPAENIDVTHFDPYGLTCYGPELNKIIFWSLVKINLEGGGKKVKVLGPRSGSLDLPAAHCLEAHTWHYFKKSIDIPGEFRFLMSAPRFLRVLHWEPPEAPKGGAKKPGRPSTTKNYGPHHQKRGNILEIRYRMIFPEDMKVFDVPPPLLPAASAEPQRMFECMISDDFDCTRGPLLPHATVSSPAAEAAQVKAPRGKKAATVDADPTLGHIPYGYSHVALEIVTPPKLDEGSQAAADDLDEFLERILVGAGGLIPDLFIQIEKVRDGILGTPGHRFVYRFYPVPLSNEPVVFK